MVPERTQRLKAASVLAQALGSAEHRKLFEKHGFQPGQQIVLALDSDTVGDVLGRVKEHSPPVTVAIYFVETGKIGYTDISPTAPIKDHDADRDDVGKTATIGMLYRYVERQRSHRFNFRLTGWDSVQVSSFGPKITELV
ncbi:hypothetical protein [Streptomyces griseoluteus]|uniref:hypothetical protein n=1 Tax=Streptomyces griseoluteus TaxID=29306 RepID=UPI0036F8DF92